jgi:hypothetical protein
VRTVSGLTALAILCGLVPGSALAQTDAAREQAMAQARAEAAKTIDWSKKRVADTGKVRQIYKRDRGFPYIRKRKKDGTFGWRRLFRSSRRRLGRPQVTAEVPAFLRDLQTWRERRKAGGRP